MYFTRNTYHICSIKRRIKNTWCNRLYMYTGELLAIIQDSISWCCIWQQMTFNIITLVVLNKRPTFLRIITMNSFYAVRGCKSKHFKVNWYSNENKPCYPTENYMYRKLERENNVYGKQTALKRSCIYVCADFTMQILLPKVVLPSNMLSDFIFWHFVCYMYLLNAFETKQDCNKFCEYSVQKQQQWTTQLIDFFSYTLRELRFKHQHITIFVQ